MPEKTASLYTRLGGYDAIAAVVDDLLPRLRQDSLLGRFWTSPRSVDTSNRERQLAVDFIVAVAGGPTIYPGTRHEAGTYGHGHHQGRLCGVYAVLIGHSGHIQVPEPERGEVVAFALGLEPEIAEA